MKLQESHEEQMCVLVAPDGSWQGMTLSPDYASCLAIIRLLHKAGMSQSYHDLVKLKGFQIVPVKVTVIDNRPEEEIQKKYSEKLKHTNNMKKLVLFIGITASVSAITLALPEKKQPPRLYPVSLSLEEWQLKINYLEYVKQSLRKSDLPSKEVALITDSALTPFQNQIAAQIQSKLAQEKAAQQNKDTTKSKKN